MPTRSLAYRTVVSLAVLLTVVVATPGLAAVCGNGTREGGEQCDDGNVASGDGCSAACLLECASLSGTWHATLLNGAPGGDRDWGIRDDGAGNLLLNTGTPEAGELTGTRTPVSQVVTHVTILLNGQPFQSGEASCTQIVLTEGPYFFEFLLDKISGSYCGDGSVDPGAVCGDGVVTTPCARCDDGVANSDTAPDACRSDCFPARRGDGVVDAGEECDDGNFASCDGCDAGGHLEPGFACGDGVTSRACGEQCDDDNGTVLDGCSPSCTLERIPGGGSPATDCVSEWSVDDPSNLPAYDKHGAISATQSCVDDDATCDHDGGTPGSCTFRVRGCANNTDVAGCEAPPRLASWELLRPSDAQGVKRPYLAALRAALLASIPAATVGTDGRDVCSDFTDVTVPLRVAGGRQHLTKVKLKTRATTYEGKVDQDGLTLVCLPRP